MKKVVFFVLLFAASIKTHAQAKEIKDVSFDQLNTETQFSSDNLDYIEMFWWLPTEFWEVLFSQDPTVDEQEVNEIVNLVNDYLIVVVIKGKIGMFGGIKYESEEDLKAHVQITYQQEKLSLVDKKEMPAELVNILSIMKPVMANMLGNMGENLHFFVYDNPKGKNILPVDVLSEKELRFDMDGFSTVVDLPLSSLLQEKTCPVDGRDHSGKWVYCPFHGKKLLANQ